MSRLLLDTVYRLHRFPLAGIQSSSNNLRQVWEGILCQLREYLDAIDFNFKGRFASYVANHSGIWYLCEDLLLQIIKAVLVPSSSTILNNDLNWLRSSHSCRSTLVHHFRAKLLHSPYMNGFPQSK